MHISPRVRHGARLLMTLAHNSKKVPLRAESLSRNIGISPKYMEKIIKPLRQAGIVKGLRGRGGGYYLGRSPDEITLGEIVRVVDGGVRFHCRLDPDQDSPLAHYGSPNVWAGVSNSLEGRLNAITLTGLMQEPTEPSCGHQDAPVAASADAARAA